MKQPDCPRCLEPFARNERFCKKCGLRKNRSFSQKRWWLVALVIDVLIVLLAGVIREKLLLATGQALDIATGTIWGIFALLGFSLLLPVLCLNGVYSVFWLRKHGATVEGEVVEHREYHTRKGRTMLAAVVVFLPDIAQPVPCQVEHMHLLGVLPPQAKVPVRYDPYNPGGCAQVGADWSKLIFKLLSGLMLAGIPVLIVVLMLMVTANS